MSIGISSRLRLVYPGRYLIWCPGCERSHLLEIGSRQEFDKHLGYDGDHRFPTFDPAIVITTPLGLCIFELRGGVLHFRKNCHHELRGQEVPLPYFPLA